MKVSLIVVALFFSFTVSAWEKIFDCNQSNMVIDRQCEFRGEFPQTYSCTYQLVIHNQNVLDELFFRANPRITAPFVIPVKAQNGYGKFEADFYDAVIRVLPEAGTLGLRVVVFEDYRGGLIARRNWFFDSCQLIQRY